MAKVQSNLIYDNNTNLESANDDLLAPPLLPLLQGVRQARQSHGLGAQAQAARSTSESWSMAQAARNTGESRSMEHGAWSMEHGAWSIEGQREEEIKFT